MVKSTTKHPVYSKTLRCTNSINYQPKLTNWETNFLSYCFILYLLYVWKQVEHLLTNWAFLIGKKNGVVASIHVSHANVVTVSPVQLPEGEYEYDFICLNLILNSLGNCSMRWP